MGCNHHQLGAMVCRVLRRWCVTPGQRHRCFLTTVGPDHCYENLPKISGIVVNTMKNNHVQRNTLVSGGMYNVYVCVYIYICIYILETSTNTSDVLQYDLLNE